MSGQQGVERRNRSFRDMASHALLWAFTAIVLPLIATLLVYIWNDSTDRLKSLGTGLDGINEKLGAQAKDLAVQTTILHGIDRRVDTLDRRVEGLETRERGR